jgi:hypothetical protein
LHGFERPKAKALGYLGARAAKNAKAKAKAKTKAKAKYRDPFDCVAHKVP